ncbi:hypothetical protein C7M84_025523 [Penaeus vannamei]|uniref:Uncharacterized protein n=1 Tax=Penaeus vannamei TaxID=6689 RepID=A0A3R7PBX9_PENVA|nr:hypothetical protein C7M84_025523 [Penaeus vannamei]
MQLPTASLCLHMCTFLSPHCPHMVTHHERCFTLSHLGNATPPRPLSSHMVKRGHSSLICPHLSHSPLTSLLSSPGHALPPSPRSLQPGHTLLASLCPRLSTLPRFTCSPGHALPASLCPTWSHTPLHSVFTCHTLPHSVLTWSRIPASLILTWSTTPSPHSVSLVTHVPCASLWSSPGHTLPHLTSHPAHLTLHSPVLTTPPLHLTLSHGHATPTPHPVLTWYTHLRLALLTWSRSTSPRLTQSHLVAVPCFTLSSPGHAVPPCSLCPSPGTHSLAFCPHLVTHSHSPHSVLHLDHAVPCSLCPHLVTHSLASLCPHCYALTLLILSSPGHTHPHLTLFLTWSRTPRLAILTWSHTPLASLSSLGHTLPRLTLSHLSRTPTLPHSILTWSRTPLTSLCPHLVRHPLASLCPHMVTHSPRLTLSSPGHAPSPLHSSSHAHTHLLPLSSTLVTHTPHLTLFLTWSRTPCLAVLTWSHNSPRPTLCPNLVTHSLPSICPHLAMHPPASL